MTLPTHSQNVQMGDERSSVTGETLSALSIKHNFSILWLGSGMPLQSSRLFKTGWDLEEITQSRNKL
jgi:hypothetical protein